MYSGRAPRTKETLPNFRERCRAARHSQVFHGLTGSQRTPRNWGVTRWACGAPASASGARAARAHWRRLALGVLALSVQAGRRRARRSLQRHAGPAAVAREVYGARAAGAWQARGVHGARTAGARQPRGRGTRRAVWVHGLCTWCTRPIFGDG